MDFLLPSPICKRDWSAPPPPKSTSGLWPKWSGSWRCQSLRLYTSSGEFCHNNANTNIYGNRHITRQTFKKSPEHLKQVFSNWLARHPHFLTYQSPVSPRAAAIDIFLKLKLHSSFSCSKCWCDIFSYFRCIQRLQSDGQVLYVQAYLFDLTPHCCFPWALTRYEPAVLIGLSYFN